MPISVAPTLPMSQMSNVGGLANYATGFVQSHPHGMSDDFMSSDAFKYSEYVNAREREAADKQMRFQEEQNAKAMAFNASEAEKVRSWQERLSNTAHQRQVSDFLAAGLNPVLSIIGSSGSSTPSGSSASFGSGAPGAKANVNSSAMELIVTELSKILERQTQMQLQTEQLKTQMDIAKMQNAMNEFIGLLSADTSKYGSNMSAWSARYVADKNYEATLDSPANTWAGIIGRLFNTNDDRDNAAKNVDGKYDLSAYNNLASGYGADFGDFFKWLKSKQNGRSSVPYK